MPADPAALPVRRLAEFVFRSGDLHKPRRGRQVDAEEGIAVQKAVQQQRLQANSAYEREFTLKLELSAAQLELDRGVCLQGRIDGLLSGVPVLIEEFKCCGELPEAADPVDLGQALIYAGLHSQQTAAAGDHQYRVAVVYVQADTLQERAFNLTLSAVQARWVLSFVLLCYRARCQRHEHRCRDRLAYAAGLQFPFARYRRAQQAVARRVYRALRQRESLLLEAPTGSGKTMAVVYPALRAQGAAEQLLFLTSRNVGARAALDALHLLDRQQKHIAVVELTAKEKICPVPGTPCNAELCANAKGYFDRSRGAVDELLSARCADRAAVAEVAARHQVCPFELSLDAALWADVIVGDYNYAFDPMVRLQRFAGDKNLHLLIDEAHQLSPRARDMLTVSLPRSLVRSAMQAAPAAFSKRAASMDRALRKLRSAYGEAEQVIPAAALAALDRAVDRLLDSVQDEHLELAACAEAQALFFACVRWRRSRSWLQEETFQHSLQVDRRELEVRRICLDPAPYIDAVLREHGANVRFSGTVSPLELYQRLHGQQQAAAERAASPFEPRQLALLHVTDIPTYYRQRQASAARVAGVVKDMQTARAGRYLVALPSYEYLQLLQHSLAQMLPHTPLLAQERQQSRDDHEQMLNRFVDAGPAVMLIVSGGVFGESVDFSRAPLQGVVLVGLGLPPPTLERALIQSHFDEVEGRGWGKLVAYTQPALVKNIQAAGRLIRSPNDRGVICLVDPRFGQADVQHFFPAFWQPRRLHADDVRPAVESFWRETDLT